MSRLAGSAATLTRSRLPESLTPKTGPKPRSSLRLASALIVQRLVDQLVRPSILGPRHAADAPPPEPAQRGDGLGVERLHRRVLDLVGAGQLARHQLGVAHDLDLGSVQRPGALEAPQQRPVLGDVVRRHADPLGHLVEHLAVGSRDDDPDRGRSWVAPGAAVDVQDHLHGAVGPTGGVAVSIRGQLRKLAGDAWTAAIAHLAIASAGRAAAPARGLAA